MRKIKFYGFSLLFLTILNLTAQDYESRVVGYIPAWGNMPDIISQTDFSGFSHVMLAFANPDAQGNMSIGSLGATTVQNLIDKAHQSGCLVLISIGGGSTDINAAWLQNLKPENHATINQNLIDLMNLYHFDGIDVDLEGDLVLSANYAGFITDLDELLPSYKLLTAAMATWSASKLTAATLSHFDFINVMSYDQTGPWNANNPGPHSSYDQAVSDIKYWKNTKGLPADKVVLGVPFYGYNFTDKSNVTSMTYKEIVSQNVGAEELDQIDKIYYNGQPTIVAKAKLAAKSAGGIMIWEITQDVLYTDQRSLLKSIHSVIKPIQTEILATEPEIKDNNCFPIPASDHLMISDADPFTPISIVNLEGKLFWTGEANHHKVDTTSLNPGIYCIIYFVNHQKQVKKFTKL